MRIVARLGDRVSRLVKGHTASGPLENGLLSLKSIAVPSLCSVERTLSRAGNDLSWIPHAESP